MPVKSTSCSLLSSISTSNGYASWLLVVAIDVLRSFPGAEPCLPYLWAFFWPQNNSTAYFIFCASRSFETERNYLLSTSGIQLRGELVTNAGALKSAHHRQPRTEEFQAQPRQSRSLTPFPSRRGSVTIGCTGVQAEPLHHPAPAPRVMSGAPQPTASCRSGSQPATSREASAS
ncbi:hypothetical protein DFH06DRAFT_531087 [Mycena polygramma]|nr:hypothetical protein DFH06DRAFT_531087 [Mycena polygramma]